MISACGAESRMSKKYGLSVEEAKMHAQHTSPFLSLQFGLIVGNIYSFVYKQKSVFNHDPVLQRILGVCARILVWN